MIKIISDENNIVSLKMGFNIKYRNSLNKLVSMLKIFNKSELELLILLRNNINILSIWNKISTM